MNDGLCRSCGAPILFIQMKSGKWMPVDKKEIVIDKKWLIGKHNLVGMDGQMIMKAPYGTIGFKSHFSTCPDSNKYRKKENRDGEQQGTTS